MLQIERPETYIHGDESNGLGPPLMSDEVILERGKGFGLATLPPADRADAQRVMKDRQIAQTRLNCPPDF